MGLGPMSKSRAAPKKRTFTSITLAAPVTTWLMSQLQFQVDMGLLLSTFSADTLGAILMLPAGNH
jgi:uncharacterized protein